MKMHRGNAMTALKTLCTTYWEQSVQMKGRWQVKEGFLSLENIETWIVYVCHSEGEWAIQNI